MPFERVKVTSGAASPTCRGASVGPAADTEGAASFFAASPHPTASCEREMVAKAGAFLVSPFIGRLDDIGEDGMELIRQIRTVYDNYGFKTKILAASVRHTNHLLHCALSGADVATCPLKVITDCMKHPLTDIGIEKFLADYKKAFG